MSIYKQHGQVLNQVGENAATMLDTRNMQISFYTKNITNHTLQTSVEIQCQVISIGTSGLHKMSILSTRGRELLYKNARPLEV